MKKKILGQGGMQTPKVYRPTYKFRLKKVLNKVCFLAYQMQNFLKQADVQPQNHYVLYLYILD